jgi:hypothetical protein
MKRISSLALIAFLWFGLASLACNLTSPETPPTIVPRMTDTPLPTLGVAIAATPQELPRQPAPGPQVGANLANMLNMVESDRLFLHIDTLQRTQTRHVNSTTTDPNTGIGAAYRYVRSQFDAIAQQSAGNFSVFDHTFPLKWSGVDTTQTNVVGVIPGREIGGGILLLGAHYDSISIDPNDPTYYAPGANDNASGTSALIELARILATRQHNATIMFVAFGAEEVGRVGSIEFVKYLQSRGITVDAMLNMDIIGSQTGPNGQVDDSTLRLFSAGPNESPSRQLARAIYLIDYNLIPNMAIRMQDAGDREGRYSDHLSFSDAGFPAVRFIESLEDRVRQHTPNDTIEDVQATYLTRATQTVLTVASVYADGLIAPRNISLRANGNTRTLVWEPVPGAASYLIALRRPGSLIYDQQFPWNGNSVDWEGFVSSQYVGLVISSVDANGLMGPPSPELAIP